MLEVTNQHLMFKKSIFLLIILFFSTFVQAQIILQPTTSSVYEFLDEMAQMKNIELNSAVKPYSRMFIAKKLQEIEVNEEALNKRQKKELAFYFQDFNKELKNKGDFKKAERCFFLQRQSFYFYHQSNFRI